MQLPINQQQKQYKIVDLCFYNALIRAEGDQKCTMTFFMVRIVFLAWYIINHFLNDKIEDIRVYNLVSWLFISLICFNIVNYIFKLWTYLNYVKNTDFILNIAQNIGHIGNNQQMILHNQIQNTSYSTCPKHPNMYISTHIYQFSNNMHLNEANQQYKTTAQRNCLSLISQSFQMQKWYRFWNQFFNLISIILFSFNIYILFQDNGVTSSQFSFMITYLITEAFCRFFIYIIIIGLILSPLCCLGCCIYYFFFKKQRIVVLPPAKEATIDDIRQCQGQCSICFMNINQKQMITVLKCSPKHVFHQLCIKGWIKIGHTCPMCRAQI